MRFVLCTLLLMLLGATVTTAQTNGFADWTLVDAQPASEVGETRQMVLSPDGSQLAWNDSTTIDLCTYSFDTEETICTDYPDDDPDGNNALLNIHDTLFWSPDSTRIALTEEFFRELLESDIWLYDVASSTFTDLTNDDASGSLIRLDDYDVEYIIDSYPIWHPENGDLYFFRYEPFEGGLYPFRTALYRLPNNEGTLGEPEQIIELTDQMPRANAIFNAQHRSLAGSVAFSSDATQLAILVRTAFVEDSAIWILDLTDNSVTEVATFPAWDDLGMPEWETIELVPQGLAWTADGNLVFSAIDETTLGAPITWTVYHLSVADGNVTPVFDFSDVPDASSYYGDLDADGNVANYAYPRTAIMAPDGETLLYFNFNRGLDRINLSGIDLVNGGDAFVIASIPADAFVFTRMDAVSMGYGEDTLRLLMYGYVFTFTR